MKMTEYEGRIPSDEVEFQQVLWDKEYSKIVVQSSPHGWAVLMLPHSIWCRVEADSETNFYKAVKAAEDEVGPLHITKNQK